MSRELRRHSVVALRSDDAVEDGSESGVEVEREDPRQGTTERPFDPSKIKVRTVNVVVDQIVSRIKYGEIDLQPDFQRVRGIWDAQRRSRLIESLLLRIPIPVFYVAADHDEKWAVVDGVQRISTIHDYMAGEFALTRSGISPGIRRQVLRRASAADAAADQRDPARGERH